jgi:hypothetical protein
MPTLLGVLYGFGTSRKQRVRGTGTFTGIDATGLQGGVSLKVFFREGRTIQAMASPATGAPIVIDSAGTSSLVCPARSIANFTYIDDSGTTPYWQYEGGSIGGGGGSSTPVAALVRTFGDIYPARETVDTVKDQFLGDFSPLPAGATPIELTGMARVDTGYTGTISVMVGGAWGASDGLPATTITMTGTGAYAPIMTTGNFTNPTGRQPVKLVMHCSNAAHPCILEGVYLTIGSGGGGIGPQGPPGGGSVPTGTGFRHVTSGTEDAAARAIAESDVTNLTTDLATLTSAAAAASSAASAASHTPFGADTATASGSLTIPANCRTLKATGTEDFLGMSPGSLQPGDIFYLTLASARIVRNGGSVTSPVVPLSMSTGDIPAQAGAELTWQLGPGGTLWKLKGAV